MNQCKAELTYTASEIENSICYLLEKDNQLAGFYILKPVNETSCELESFFIEPTLIGNGHGRELFGHAREIAKTSGFKNMVIQSDPNSVGFYIAVGAVQIGTKPSASIPGRVLPMLEIQI